MTNLTRIYVVVALVSTATILPVKAEPAQKCLDKVTAFDVSAKAKALRDVAPNERTAFEDFQKTTIFDMKVLCMKEDMDSAILIAFKNVCPGFVWCDRMRVVIDRGLTAGEKYCVEQIVNNLNQNAEVKRQFALRYSPEALITLSALGDKCSGK